MSGRFAVDPRQPDPAGPSADGRRRAWVVVWLPGLAVALGAAVATAHGLYEVAVAARVPGGIAWIYPLITDGLALVAYAATARLQGSAARYAWMVVVLAAGLSGLAQASFLASDPVAPGATLSISAALRFGVGAWPAVAAAIVAHLLYLLATHTGAGTSEVPGLPVPGGRSPDDRSTGSVQPEAFNRAPDALPLNVTGTPALPSATLTTPASAADSDTAVEPDIAPERAEERPVEAPARDRARRAATKHAARHGAWPTVSELETAASVSRGTAAGVLKTLREHPNPLQLVTEHNDTKAQP